MSKIIFTFIGGLVLIFVTHITNIIITTLIGILAGMLLDWMLPSPIIKISAAPTDNFSLYFWQIGALAGFIFGFFKNHIRFHTEKNSPNKTSF